MFARIDYLLSNIVCILNTKLRGDVCDCVYKPVSLNNRSIKISIKLFFFMLQLFYTQRLYSEAHQA